MTIEITTDHNSPAIDWQRLADLLELSGLNKRHLPTLELAFTRSQFRYFGYLGGELVAAARAISDFTTVSYVCDVAIHPAYQGQGYGKVLMQRIMQDLTPLGKVIIYAVPDKIEFYKKFGFNPLLTAMIHVSEENLIRMQKTGYIPQ